MTDAWATRIALLIGIVSIVSAVVAWRASVASIEETAAQVRAVQSAAQRLQVAQRIEGLVDQDERLIARYQEHIVAARELKAAAEEARATDVELADRLDLEAQGRLALARQLQRFFLAAVPDDPGEGGVVYEPEFVARNLREGTPQFRELQPERFIELAETAGTRDRGLVAIALLLVTALFFLTVGQLIHHPSRLGLVAVGGILAVVGGAGFILLEVLLAT